ncbi:MAG: alpha/beta hydrolase, partial [Christensenellales bacterium]
CAIASFLCFIVRIAETPLWMGKMMEEKIPDAGLVVEKGAGHFAYLEQNQRFLRIVKNFLLEGRA